jgi:RNA polymerase sigma-70 factor, ECF subfamily
MSQANHATRAALSDDSASERVVARDRDLMLAAQAGSMAAFAELYAIYSRRLYKRLLYITRRPEDAEDALQDTYLRAALALHNFEGRASVYSWLTRIAINSGLMILRKRRYRAEVWFDSQPDDWTEGFVLEIKDTALNPEEAYDLNQRRIRMQHAIGNLEDCLRAPIHLRIAKESTMKEIGRTLNITEGAVKARLHRARLRLSLAFQER